MRFHQLLFATVCAGFLTMNPPACAEEDPLESLLPKIGGEITESRSSLAAEAKSIAAGEPFSVALQLVHPPKWHSYYLNSGGIEIPPSIEWKLPDGFTAGPIQWPVPEVKDGLFGKSFVYSGSPVFLVEITPPASLEAGKTVTLQADAAWQICEDLCKDEKASFKIELPVAASAEPDPAHADGPAA